MTMQPDDVNLMDEQAFLKWLDDVRQEVRRVRNFASATYMDLTVRGSEVRVTLVYDYEDGGETDGLGDVSE